MMKITFCIFSFLYYCGAHSKKLDPRVYTFAFSNDGFPANFIENGLLVGQSIDMVHKVCRIAQKDCAVVFVPRKQCWDTNEFPPFSQVLNTRVFDVCANLPLSPERNFTYLFAKESFFRTPFPQLIAPFNSEITVDDLKTCNNYTVAFPANTAVEPDCLLDLGLFIREENFIPVSSRGDLIDYMHKIADMVVRHKVTLGIILPRFLRHRKDVKSIVELSCENEYKRGLNIMVRFDNKAVVAWWQSTLLEYMCVGTAYKRFCRQLETKYDIDPLCRVPGEDLDCSKFGGAKAVAVKQAKRIPRINPCVQKCKTQVLKYGQTFFEFMDDPERKSHKALKGANDQYKADSYTDVTFTIASKSGKSFKVKRLCLTASYVSLIKFTFRSFGSEAIRESAPPAKYYGHSFSICLNGVDGFHNEVVIVFVLHDPIQTRVERRIRVSNLYMETCAF